MAEAITGVATLDSAGPAQIACLANPKYRSKLASTRAGALILGPGERDAVSIPRIVTDHPYAYYARTVALFNPPPPVKAGRHPTAEIHPEAIVAGTAEIGAFAVIGHGARIGERTAIGASGAWWPIDLAAFPARVQQQVARLLFSPDGIALSGYRYNIGGGGVGVTAPPAMFEDLE